MRKSMALAVAASALLAGCNNRDRFDLHCELKETNARVSQGLTMDYRVDTKARRFCQHDCANTGVLLFVDDRKLVIGTTDYMGVSNVTTIDRETGNARHTFIAGDAEIVSVGSCEKKPFSGFPEPKI